MAVPFKNGQKKKAACKKGFDKQLIRLSKRLHALSCQQKSLPVVPLEQPYQKGWVRYFVLREDVKKDMRAEFFDSLLKKINTWQYHHDQGFRLKKRRRGRYGYYNKAQNLREFTWQEWRLNQMKLNDDEKIYFNRVEYCNIQLRRIEIKYVFAESWRFMLKVTPYVITHKKLHDADLAHQIKDTRDYLYLHYGRWIKITRGHRYNGYSYAFELPKYINKLKNMPVYRIQERYAD